jgi:hypothetical protein
MQIINKGEEEMKGIYRFVIYMLAVVLMVVNIVIIVRIEKKCDALLVDKEIEAGTSYRAVYGNSNRVVR